MAKFVEFHQTGGPEVLQIVEKEPSTPGDNELLVKIKAAGLNQAELLYFMGHYVFQPKFPSKVGLEASGIVANKGKNVTDFELGDEVCLTPNIMHYEYGYLGEYALVPGEAIIKKPKSLSFDEAASFWMTYATSYTGLVLKGGLNKGADQTVVISAASSAVGIAAIQMAKNFGARVIATSRTFEKKDFLESQGADFVIATEEENFVEKVNEFTEGEGFQIAFDPIGGTFWNELADAAGQEARIIVYGALSLDFESPFPTLLTFVKGLSFIGFHLVFHLLQHPNRFEKVKKHLLEGLEQRIYKPVIDRSFTLEEMQNAYEYMMSGKQKGKILVKP
ncbi:MAG: zinc-dependent alcohol dehydrogenase family protein [Bacteroidota bacterium]